MEIGTVFGVCSASAGQLLGILMIVIPGPIQPRNLQAGLVQHIFIDQDQIVLHFSRNTISLVIDLQNNIISIFCRDSFFFHEIIQWQIGTRHGTYCILGVVGCHQNIDRFTTHQHNICLGQVITAVHVAYIIKLYGYVWMQLLIGLSNLLISCVMIGLPADKTKRNFLLIILCPLCCSSFSSCFCCLSLRCSCRCLRFSPTGTSCQRCCHDRCHHQTKPSSHFSHNTFSFRKYNIFLL